MANGLPFAVIVRVEINDANAETPKKIGESLVIKGLQGYEKIDASVDAKTPRANEKARQIADGQFAGSAQALLDSRKADLKSKWATIKDTRGAQLSSDLKKNLEDAMKRSAEKMTGTMAKITDLDAAPKYEKLMKDWGDIVAVS